MNPLDLLRLLAASSSGAGTGDAEFPAVELRFVLEYASAPDLEAQRARIAGLLDDAPFVLVPFPGPGLEEFLVLRFPGVEPTLPARDLFSLGYALCDELALVSAEPDLGSPFFADPLPTFSARETESARVIGPLCWVAGEAPPDRGWALAKTGVPGAWQRARGEGIVVGQPDSGVADHDELGSGMLRLDLAWNALTGTSDPTDPLRDGAANPGHGTGTASLVASRAGGVITGAAPASELVPIRCLDDVKIFNAAPVAAAIAHARKVGCHVVSMSLGGVPSRALHRAIKEAVTDDMIVVAAAGNCVQIVVWPARYDDVIAVAGTNAQDRLWKGSSRGAAVDIAAPAELVWRAQRARPSDPVSAVAPGQGTSFATAIVAGIAALWLAAHGRAAVIGEARRRGTSVQALFRTALRQTARIPANWDDERFGSGVVDAEALVGLPLADIASGGHESIRNVETMVAFLNEEFGPAARDAEFNWPRYQAEIASIALVQANLGSAPTSLRPETKWLATRPSPALSIAATASTDLRLKPFAEAPGAPAGRPMMLPATSELRRPVLQRRGGAGLEGLRTRSGQVDLEAKRSYLERLDNIVSKSASPSPLDRQILEAAEEAFDRLADDRADWSAKARVGLEALVRLTGRPALRVRGGRIDVDDPRGAEWRDRFILMLGTGVIESHLPSIGRIDCEGSHVGTGYVIGSGLILTNRHVLQAFAAPVPRRNEPDRWVMTSADVTIDFADKPTSLTVASKFRIVDVVGAGPADIDFDRIDLAALDLAVLAAETTNGAGRTLPPRLPLDSDPTSVDHGRTLLVVGYPAQPASLPTRTDGSFDAEVSARLNAIFGADYGTKYTAPGDVSAVLGSWTADVERRVFAHDATTLVGNSGSAIIGANAPQDIVGLHFGGQWLAENYAHGLAALKGRVPALADSSISWTNPS